MTSLEIEELESCKERLDAIPDLTSYFKDLNIVVYVKMQINTVVAIIRRVEHEKKEHSIFRIGRVLGRLGGIQMTLVFLHYDNNITPEPIELLKIELKKVQEIIEKILNF